ncbi:MAG: diaminopimelate epimerase [Smithellaceae bacterium]|nr:diaminopimelate epimerase [Smithellaceae bacterium]
MIDFYKMSGSGNDFIVIDHRDRRLDDLDIIALVKKICQRAVSVGADGLILIEESNQADFQWRFFNADGSEVEMCGNGGRCAARFAYLKGIAAENMSFVTRAGIIDATVNGSRVKIRLTDPKNLALNSETELLGKGYLLHSINTGVPHVVSYHDDLEQTDVFRLGREIRYHAAWQPAGTNANFVKVLGRHTLQVRTYERGVEDETLACGTGAVAAALISASLELVESPVEVIVRIGESLNIYFERNEAGFHKVYLEGSAQMVYEGRLWDEAYK